ncbi:MAG: thiamine phosphate synthase [Bacteroidota bacterium]
MKNKCVLISLPDSFSGEAELINQMFALGEFIFHLRKKESSSHQIKKILFKINPEFYDRIIIHQHYELLEKFNLGGVHLPEAERIQKTELKSNGIRIVSTSIHDLNQYEGNKSDFEYVFFSPVFKSISKENYSPKLDIETIKNKIHVMSPNNLIALAGVTKDNFQYALDAGFNGVALLGAVWNSKNPVGYFSEFLNAFKVASK